MFPPIPPASSPPLQSDGVLQTDSDEPESPALYRTRSYDAVLFDIRKIQPEKIAVGHTAVGRSALLATDLTFELREEKLGSKVTYVAKKAELEKQGDEANVKTTSNHSLAQSM